MNARFLSHLRRSSAAVRYVRNTSTPAVRSAQIAGASRRHGERLISDPLLPLPVGPSTGGGRDERPFAYPLESGEIAPIGISTGVVWMS